MVRHSHGWSRTARVPNAPSPHPYLRGTPISASPARHVFAEGAVAITLAGGRHWIPSRREPERGALQSGLRYGLCRERLGYLLGAVSRIHAGLGNAASASPAWGAQGGSEGGAAAD